MVMSFPSISLNLFNFISKLTQISHIFVNFSESYDQQQMQGPNYKHQQQQQNYYHHHQQQQPGSPTAGVPPHQLPPHMNGSAGGYALHNDRGVSISCTKLKPSMCIVY